MRITRTQLQFGSQPTPQPPLPEALVAELLNRPEMSLIPDGVIRKRIAKLIARMHHNRSTLGLSGSKLGYVNGPFGSAIRDILNGIPDKEMSKDAKNAVLKLTNQKANKIVSLSVQASRPSQRTPGTAEREYRG